jgi:putative membrane-bound dehydrogenase-like protein
MSRTFLSRARYLSVVALGVAAVGLIFVRTARTQVGPEASAKMLKVADGLEATLWAAEPMVVNPTSMDVDSRGRVWISEGLNYRLTRGGNRQFNRIEDADKIKILEDTNADGKADKMTVFADRIFPVPMGLAVEERYSAEGKYEGCRVFVGNSPDILVLEDTDGDDKADKRYSLLSGFGGIDSDHGVHGMVLGLDGKLYFTHGDGCCSVQQDHSERVQNFDVLDKSGRHVSSAELANTLRVNRDGTQFEIIADRQRNPYETCLNSFGNIFTSDNDDDGNRGSRVIWVMDGGKYGYRTPGSPRHWGEDVPGMVPKLVGTGNGSPCGVMVYEGSLLPKEYAGCVFEAEAGPRQVNFFPLTREGAAFRTEHKVLLSSDDPWFRPIDVTAGPDGSVFVADWYDAGVGGHAFRDQTTGRIYRVAPKGSKPSTPKPDFGTIDGLIAALRSPAVATRDAARRGLVARGDAAVPALLKLFQQTEDTIGRARALWVLAATSGESTTLAALKDTDPRIRELAVRILGRDVSRVGTVELTKPEARAPLPAEKHLEALLPLAKDADAGVRRELILALRDVPTAGAGPALKSLARAWDGQDRWYLEALGLALKNREPGFLAQLFDGRLYGDLALADSATLGAVALPPYFPVDRNEAFIATGEKSFPSNALTKTLGLAWMIHRAEVLPLLSKIMPSLATPELQQAADDVIGQITDPAGAVALAELSAKTADRVQKRQYLATLGRKLEGAWRPAQSDPAVIKAIEAALADTETRAEGIQTAAATGDARYADTLLAYVADEMAPAEVRVAAVEAIGRIKHPKAQATLDELIAKAKERKSSNPAAEAAVRTLARLSDAKGRLAELVVSDEVPLGLRREALRSLAQRGQDGGMKILAIAKDGKLAADLKTEATTVLNTHPDRRVREEASRMLPLPKTAGGKPLPPFYELVRRDGNAENGRAIFFRTGTNACGTCHRVQGSGQWIGPDLSTVGTKYGKDELLRSILNPSASIPYNYHSYVVALRDGRVLTGLPVEETGERLVLKLADGKRVTLRGAEVEEKKVSEVSLMPEGLAETMGEQDLVDVLAFLSTLKVPVSIVGQFQALGPVAEASGKTLLDPQASVDAARPVKGPDGQTYTWRRIKANAEGLVDLSPLTANDPGKVVYLHAPVVSSVEQSARFVLDTKADVKVWLGGKLLELPAQKDDAPRLVTVHLGKGTTDLMVRVPGGENAAIVATFVAPRTLEFSPDEVVHASPR